MHATSLHVLGIGHSGSLEKLSVHELGVGDLLDIHVYVDVTVYRADDSVPRTAIYLAFDRIVRLVKAKGPVGRSTVRLWQYADNLFISAKSSVVLLMIG